MVNAWQALNKASDIYEEIDQIREKNLQRFYKFF